MHIFVAIIVHFIVCYCRGSRRLPEIRAIIFVTGKHNDEQNMVELKALAYDMCTLPRKNGCCIFFFKNIQAKLNMICR